MSCTIQHRKYASQKYQNTKCQVLRFQFMKVQVLIVVLYHDNQMKYPFMIFDTELL